MITTQLRLARRFDALGLIPQHVRQSASALLFLTYGSVRIDV